MTKSTQNYIFSYSLGIKTHEVVMYTKSYLLTVFQQYQEHTPIFFKILITILFNIQ
jgi:hypothetical protein